jgi:Mycoplasma protein of unknown function, DUF285
MMPLNKQKVNEKRLREIVAKCDDNADLNYLDVSDITNMCDLFAYSSFNGNISEWDVSNVKYMGLMFENSNFNGDISKWQTSSVEHISRMFYGSKFNGDISSWDVSKVVSAKDTFIGSSFNGDMSKWKMTSMTPYDSSIFNANGAVQFGTIGDLFNSVFSNSLGRSTIKIGDEIVIARQSQNSNFAYTVSVNGIDCIYIDNENTIFSTTLSEIDKNFVIGTICEHEKQNIEKRLSILERTTIADIEAAALIDGIIRLKNGSAKKQPIANCSTINPFKLSIILGK